MYETDVTCQTCFAQSRYHVTEWPPAVFVCSCGKAFEFLSDDEEGAPLFLAAETS